MQTATEDIIIITVPVASVGGEGGLPRVPGNTLRGVPPYHPSEIDIKVITVISKKVRQVIGKMG